MVQLDGGEGIMDEGLEDGGWTVDTDATEDFSGLLPTVFKNMSGFHSQECCQACLN